ncbi:MAG: PSD1 domain-containing protein [Verrucomicrobia bacterium]|nr:PSD1 domain-containing protein [Verrucomicrobiota bacterium]
MTESREQPATFWTAVAERSGDTAFASRGAELSSITDRFAGRQSGVALRFPPHSKTRWASLASLFGCIGLLSAAPAPDGPAFFEAKIRPLFIEHCQKCHGEKKQEGGLRLDTKAGWQKGGDHGPVIVPGDPDKSRLIQAVRRKDKDFQMPPKRALGSEEVAALEQWVKLGAPDPREGVAVAKSGVDPAAVRKHWAFQPLTHPQPPAAKPNAWSQQPLDRFVLARMQQQGLQPNPPADPRALIRRMTFDLTGLPPTPEEIEAFERDISLSHSPTFSPATGESEKSRKRESERRAYEALIDRLLASPAYGERWGRHWLDVARYADTAGDGADYPVREAVKYRDWVVNAFNADQPFNEFIREQIAGDILAAQGPPADYARRITATGFLAIGKRYGYKPSPDYQHLDFADAIDSVGRSLLGLSLGCARCHGHKYDPVNMGDYYALYGIFQSTKWAFPGGEEQKRPSDFPPLVPREEAASLDKAKAAELARLDASLAKLKADRVGLDGKSIGGGPDLGFELQKPGEPPTSPWLSSGPNKVLAEAQSPFAHIHPAGTRGVRVGTGKANDGVRYVFARPLKAAPGKQMHFSVDFRTVAPTDKSGAYRFYLGRGVIASLAVEVSVTTTELALRDGAKWEVIRKLQSGTWHTLRLTLDHAKKTYSGAVGVLGDLTTFADKPLGANWDGVTDTFICDAIGHVSGPAPERDLDNVGLLETPFAEPGTGPVVAPAAPADLAERLKKLDADIAATTKLRETQAAKELYPVAYGVSEDKPVNARIQLRGEPEKPGDEVPRRFLEVLGGDKLPAGSTNSGRLDLANWLTRPSNPLTARVFVNRVWQWHFGQGLVPTPSDFGLRGEPPTHPELLDWLTSEFIASGWSVKALHRLIMRSQTYQLASDDHAATLKKDPANVWLWRHARRPLDAESIRDAMLFVSGQLNRTVPGQHPFPDVQKWGYTIHNPFFAVYDTDHRSLYLMQQRNRRHPFLALFDAADPNQSVAQRLPTTTPTQTLYLMNSPFVQQQAEAFARRLLAEFGDDTKRIRLAFATTHGRVPSDAEVSDALAFLTAYRTKLTALEKPPTNDVELAWAGLARVLLTSNAFLYVD